MDGMSGEDMLAASQFGDAAMPSSEPAAAGVDLPSHPFFYHKIFGERNTGTNYLSRLIHQNFLSTELAGSCTVPVTVMEAQFAGLRGVGRRNAVEQLMDMDARRILASDFGWKHCAPPLQVIEQAPHAPMTLFVILTRELPFWLLSMYENPYHNRVGDFADFSEFIRSRWVTVERDNLSVPVLPNVIHLWNAKMRAYARLLDGNATAIHVAYENLLAGFDTEMARIAHHLPRRGEAFTNLLKSPKARDKTRDSDFSRKNSPDRILREISESDREFISACMDKEIATRFGYVRSW